MTDKNDLGSLVLNKSLKIICFFIVAGLVAFILNPIPFYSHFSPNAVADIDHVYAAIKAGSEDSSEELWRGENVLRTEYRHSLREFLRKNSKPTYYELNDAISKANKAQDEFEVYLKEHANNENNDGKEDVRMEIKKFIDG